MRIGIHICFLVAAFLISSASVAQQATVDTVATETYSVSGLGQPAEILIDQWGVPHIYANELYDVFFVQGFNAARDRLWQLDLWKRRGLGQLSEAFGPAFVEQDRAARLFIYRQDMYSEWLAYGSDAKRIATSFTDGINAFIALAQENPELMPWEFEFLGYEPAHWLPEDTVRFRSHGIVLNASSEVARALFLRDLVDEIGLEAALEADGLRRALDTPWDIMVPEDIEWILSVMPDDVLDVYRLGVSGANFTEENLRDILTIAGHNPSATLSTAQGMFDTFLTDQEDALLNPSSSNNWAVSPELTATGRPILANDPHRAQSVPSLRYMAHLVAPGLNVIGAGEPGLPGISIGHNGQIAFGLTIFYTDQEDLFVYETNPENPNEYRYQDRWEPMEVVTETINVRDGDPVTVELKFTRHGPVIYEGGEHQVAEPEEQEDISDPEVIEKPEVEEDIGDPEAAGETIEQDVGDPEATEETTVEESEEPGVMEDMDTGANVAFAVRTSWSEPGMAPYYGSVEYMRAQNWDEFLAAMNRWGSPPENQVYADADGNIGWKPAARSPIRPNWDGLLPVPGDGRYEWDGFYDMDQYPELANPERGWVATANGVRLFDEFERGVDAYPYRDMKIGFEWGSYWRPERVREVLFDLAARGDITMEDMLQLQTDHLSYPAREIIAELSELSSPDPKVQNALDLLRDWDFVMDNDSAAAALFDRWTRFHTSGTGLLGPALLERIVEPVVAERLDQPDPRIIPAIIANPGDWSNVQNPVEARDEAVLESLASAVAELEEEFGEDASAWRFGPYNEMHLRHPLSELVDEEQRELIDIGPEERCAVSNTVGNLGASWRFIVDVGNWDNALAMSNPGQSEDPNSPYYRNLFPMWLNCEAFPLLYSRERIEEVTEQHIILEPLNDTNE